MTAGTGAAVNDFFIYDPVFENQQEQETEKSLLLTQSAVESDFLQYYSNITVLPPLQPLWCAYGSLPRQRLLTAGSQTPRL